jgi:hypothetical protein
VATLAEILANIRQNIIDVPADTEARLEGWVNEAQTDAEGHPWLGLEEEHTVDTTLGTRLLGVAPSLYEESIGRPWFLTGDGVAVFLDWIPTLEDAMKDYNVNTASTAYDRPRGLLEVKPASIGAPPQFHVYPLPNAANTLGVYSSAGEYEIQNRRYGDELFLS